MRASSKSLINAGIRVADSRLYQEDHLWARYSHDKVDIGEKVARIIRLLSRTLPLSKRLTAISIGSSNEPQFRILEAFFRGGLYLLDIEKAALDIIVERIKRQALDHVYPIVGDYDWIFGDQARTREFVRQHLAGRRMNYIALHHSLYYCGVAEWTAIIGNLYRQVLAGKGAIHMVMMAPNSRDEHTTSHLYQYFAGRYFGYRNDQDLSVLERLVRKTPLFRSAAVRRKRSRVRFYVDDFEGFMAVVWMILLYPNVHRYTPDQKEEITEWVYRKFWTEKRPLVQEQDHLVIARGLSSAVRSGFL